MIELGKEAREVLQPGRGRLLAEACLGKALLQRFQATHQETLEIEGLDRGCPQQAGVQGFIEAGFQAVFLLDRGEHRLGGLVGVVNEDRCQQQGQDHQPVADQQQNKEIDNGKGKIDAAHNPLLLKDTPQGRRCTELSQAGLKRLGLNTADIASQERADRPQPEPMLRGCPKPTENPGPQPLEDHIEDQDRCQQQGDDRQAVAGLLRQDRGVDAIDVQRNRQHQQVDRNRSGDHHPHRGVIQVRSDTRIPRDALQPLPPGLNHRAPGRSLQKLGMTNVNSSDL